MPYPDALAGHPRVIFFTDFDGTITLQDTNDTLTDNLGIGYAARRQLNVQCMSGAVTFRSLFTDMMAPIRASYPECVEYLASRVQLDPHFAQFFTWAESVGLPVVILSSGLIPIIRSILERDLGAARARKIEIVANHLVLQEGRDKGEKFDAWNTAGQAWGLRFRDESDFGHDKSRTIRPYANHAYDEAKGERRPVMLYAGDGVSDLSAARETDLLFAKKGRDLVTYCEKEGVPFTVFEDWSSILKKTQALWDGKTVAQLAEEGLKEVQENGKA